MNSLINSINHDEIIYIMTFNKKNIFAFDLPMMDVTAVTLSKHYLDRNDYSGILLLLHLRSNNISKHLQTIKNIAICSK